MSWDHDIRRIEDKLDFITNRLALLAWQMRLIIRVTREERKFEMATKEAIDRLTADVQANTDATTAAAAALAGFVATVDDLTKQLQDAIANSDQDAVLAAAEALEANNTALRAAVPQVSQAVTANTPAGA